MTTRLTRLGKFTVIASIWFLIGVILMLPEWITEAVQIWMRMTYATRVGMVFFLPASFMMMVSVFAGIAYTFTCEEEPKRSEV